MNAGESRSVLVLGGGVIGLTTAIRLQEEGWNVTIWTKELPNETTSMVAAAVFRPVEPATPDQQDRVVAWCRRSLTEFCSLAANEPSSGVSPVRCTELLGHDDKLVQGVPEWFSGVIPVDCSVARPPFATRWVYETALIEMPRYMPYLVERFTKAGGVPPVERHAVSSLVEDTISFRRVVNCTGLGAGRLAGDEKVIPIRGQILCVPRLNSVAPSFIVAPTLRTELVSRSNGSKPLEFVTYIIPRSSDCILGGTWEKVEGIITDDQLAIMEVPEPEMGDFLLQECRKLAKLGCPELESMIPTVVDPTHLRVGIRPGREGGPHVNKELLVGDRICVHNYGHGGWGVSLSWGCAEEIVELFAAMK